MPWYTAKVIGSQWVKCTLSEVQYRWSFEDLVTAMRIHDYHAQVDLETRPEH